MTEQFTALAKAGTQPRHHHSGTAIHRRARHAALEGDFVILDFPDPEDPPVAYAEGLFGDVYLESKEEIDRYHLVWSYLLAKAVSPAESTTMINELAKENR